MKTLTKIVFATAITAISTFAAAEKNWTPAPGKIYAQKLSDEAMAKNPDMLSITFHGVPPGAAPKTYTMYAGSYPDRIGNADDPDDIPITELGITISDPRWHRTKDTVKKFVMMMPIHDKDNNPIGELVVAYKNDKQDLNKGNGEQERYFFAKGTKFRDELAKKIPSFAALFEQVK